MAYPIAAATKANLDAGTDDPSQARAELAALVDRFNELLGLLSQTPGANQVPVLNSSGDYKQGANYLAYRRGNYLNIGEYGSLVLTGDTQSGVFCNAQQNGTSWIRTSAGTAQAILVNSGGPSYLDASTGTAGGGITWNGPHAIYHAGNDSNLMKVDAQAGGSHWVEVASGSSTRGAATYGVTLYSPPASGHHLYMISVYASAGEASVGYIPSTTETRITVYSASVLNDRCGVKADWHSGGSSRTLYYKIWEWQ